MSDDKIVRTRSWFSEPGEAVSMVVAEREGAPTSSSGRSIGMCDEQLGARAEYSDRPT